MILANLLMPLESEKYGSAHWLFLKFIHEFSPKEVAFIMDDAEPLKDPDSLSKEYTMINSSNEETYGYKVPSKNKIDLYESFLITPEFYQKLYLKYGNRETLWKMFLNEEVEELKQFYNETLQSLLDKGIRVTAFFSVTKIPSLIKVAENYNIKIIYMDMGPVRLFTCANTCYFDFVNKLDGGDSKSRFDQFQEQYKNGNCPILSSRELLSIFLEPYSLALLRKFSSPEKYEIGVVMNPLNDIRSGTYNSNDILTKTVDIFGAENTLVRFRPGFEYDLISGIRDSSPSALDFILKCKRVVSIKSNMAMEALLWGKTAISLGQSPYSWLCHQEISDALESSASPEALSFFFIGYLVPFHLFFTPEYLEWRLSMPSENEIYMRHLNYWINYRRLEPVDFSNENAYRFRDICIARKGDWQKSFEGESIPFCSELNIIGREKFRLGVNIFDSVFSMEFSIPESQEEYEAVWTPVLGHPLSIRMEKMLVITSDNDIIELNATIHNGKEISNEIVFNSVFPRMHFILPKGTVKVVLSGFWRFCDEYSDLQKLALEKELELSSIRNEMEFQLQSANAQATYFKEVNDSILASRSYKLARKISGLVAKFRIK